MRIGTQGQGEVGRRTITDQARGKSETEDRKGKRKQREKTETHKKITKSNYLHTVRD